MKLSSGVELAYCTNVHRGNTWEETFRSLQTDVLSVRKKVCPENRYAIGLRLGANAAKTLNDPSELKKFKKWLDQNSCYVFTINGFPYGEFHGTRVKEQVYRPDWTSRERLDYTLLLFEILAELLEPGGEGSVSTLPGSFKEFIPAGEIPESIFANLYECKQGIEKIEKAKKLDLHLGLEPEPLGFFETSPETLTFFERLLDFGAQPESLLAKIGVNYDCCHLAVEGEDAWQGLDSLVNEGIRLSKIHLSSALSAEPHDQNLKLLREFVEEVYLHQVVVFKDGQVSQRIKDLDIALNQLSDPHFYRGDEWRIHFHVPLHAAPGKGLKDTRSHVLDTLDWLASNTDKCRHLEMETYTWEVLPETLRSEEVVDQIAKEYHWTLEALNNRGITPSNP